MTEVLGLAIDFGTTNSSAALVYPDEVVTLEVGSDPMPYSLRSVVYLHKNGNLETGETAIKQYLQTAGDYTLCGRCELRGKRVCKDEEPGGGCFDARLITSVKRDLPSPRTRSHSWGRDFTVQGWVGDILCSLKREAEKTTGTRIDRVVLGHPVTFGSEGRGSEAEASDAAIDGLEIAAMEHAGFDEVRLLSEPEAALWSLKEEFEGVALTVDFGGGTCDVAIVEIRADLDRPRTLARSGLAIGGDQFDSRIFSAWLEDELGFHARLEEPDGQKLPVPAWVRTKLRTMAGALAAMRDRKFTLVLRDLARKDKTGRLGAVRDLLTHGHAYAFYSRLEEAKIALSEEDDHYFSFRRPDIPRVTAEMDRAGFEAAIEDDLTKIGGAITEALDEAGLGPRDVDVVVRTGGSAAVPAFIEMLEAIFGPKKVIERPLFTTVVTGLGRYGQVMWYEPPVPEVAEEAEAEPEKETEDVGDEYAAERFEPPEADEPQIPPDEVEWTEPHGRADERPAADEGPDEPEAGDMGRPSASGEPVERPSVEREWERGTPPQPSREPPRKPPEPSVSSRAERPSPPPRPRRRFRRLRRLFSRRLRAEARQTRELLALVSEADSLHERLIARVREEGPTERVQTMRVTARQLEGLRARIEPSQVGLAPQVATLLRQAAGALLRAADPPSSKSTNQVLKREFLPPARRMRRMKRQLLSRLKDL